MKNGSSRTSGRATTATITTEKASHCRGPVWARSGSRTLDLLDVFLAHEAGGPHREDEQDHEERDPFLQVRVDDPEELLEQADDEPADQDADRVLQAAEDRRRERLDSGHGAHVGPREGDRGNQDAAEPRERRGDHEGEHHHALDVDPHHRGRVAVVGHRHERLAEQRTLEEHLHEQDGADRGHDDEELLGENAGRAEAEHGVAERRRELDLLGPPDVDRRVLEHDADRHRAQDPGERERVAEHRADGHALEADPHEPHQDDRARHRQRVGQPERDVAREAEERPHHEELALAEVQRAGGDEGDVVALGDQRVDAADAQAADQRLPGLDEKSVHGARRMASWLSLAYGRGFILVAASVKSLISSTASRIFFGSGPTRSSARRRRRAPSYVWAVATGWKSPPWSLKRCSTLACRALALSL